MFALDCGIMINPDLIRQQVESGILYGLGAAAWGEIVLGDGGDIVTQNFDRYPVTRMQSTPAIEVHLIDGASLRPVSEKSACRLSLLHSQTPSPPSPERGSAACRCPRPPRSTK